MEQQPDAFAVGVLALFLSFGVFLAYHSYRLRTRGYMRNTINSGSRDPKTHYANQQNQGKVSFLVILLAVFALYVLWRFLS